MVKPATDALPAQHGIKRYFFVQKFNYGCIGIDPTSVERTIFNRFLAWIPLMICFAFCFQIMIFASQYIKDLNLVTDALSPIWQSMLSVIKLFYFMYSKKKIVQLVRKVWMWNLEARDEELQIIAEENRKDLMFSITFCCCVTGTAIFAIIAPFAISLFNYKKGYGFWDSLEPPLKAAYFVDMKSYFGYTVGFCWNTVAIQFIVNGTLATDTLFSWFMHNISAQFRILNLRFKFAGNAVRRPGDDEEFEKAIILLIKYHRRIIDLANNFNEVFKVTVFLTFALSFLQIACLCYQFTRDTEVASQLFHFSFIIAASLQLMLYCYGGQRMKDESNSVAVAICYYLKWNNLSIKSKKLLLLPIMSAQKPCDVNGIFFVADLNLFLWVFRTAASFIAMLLTLDDKE